MICAGCAAAADTFAIMTPEQQAWAHMRMVHDCQTPGCTCQHHWPPLRDVLPALPGLSATQAAAAAAEVAQTIRRTADALADADTLAEREMILAEHIAYEREQRRRSGGDCRSKLEGPAERQNGGT